MVKKNQRYYFEKKRNKEGFIGYLKKFEETLFICLLGDIVSMPFDLSMKDLFSGCENKILENLKGPFSSNTRALLVDSILNDVIFCKVKNISKLTAESDNEHINSPKGKNALIIVFYIKYLFRV